MARWFDWVLDQFGLRTKQPKPTKPAPPPPIPPETVPEPETQPVPVPIPPAPIPPPPTSSGLDVKLIGPDISRLSVEKFGRNVVITYAGDRYSTDFTQAPGYRVEVRENGALLKSVDVPFHYWGARVPIIIDEAPITRTRQELTAARLVPPYKDQSVVEPNPVPAPGYAPMNLGGITGWGGGTGERYDIGVFNEYDADYIGTGRGIASVESWANGAFTYSVWITENGELVDLNANPNFRSYYFPQDKIQPGIAIEPGHAPEICYLRWLLRGYEFDLQQLHAYANWVWGFGAWRGLNPNDIQTRGVAWTLRTLILAYLSAPEERRHGVFEKAYWKSAIDQFKAFFVQHWLSDYNKKKHFHSIGFAMPWWQDSMVTEALNFGEWAAPSLGLRQILEYMMQGIVDRYSGLTGWPKDAGPGYWLFWAYDKNTGQPLPEFVPNFDDPSVVAYESYERLYAVNAHGFPIWGKDNYYMSYDRFNLVMARDFNQLSLPGLAEAYANVVPNVIPQGRRHAV